MKKLSPLNIIEKAVNFLKRRFDRFKHKYTFDELSELIKILGTDRNEFGVENSGNKFTIWKSKTQKKKEKENCCDSKSVESFYKRVRMQGKSRICLECN
jgi:hypothetical protein